VAADARELDRLARFVTRPGPRFGLALALFADARVAREARAQLAAEAAAAGKTVATLELDHDDGSADLVARMIEAGAGADALWVVGLDRLIVDGLGRLRQTPAIANLNQRRDELPELLELRVVFWLAREHDAAFGEVAWDLLQVILTTAELEGQQEVALSAEDFDEADAFGDEQERIEDDDRKVLEAQLQSLTRVLEQTEDPRSLADAASSAGEIAVRLGERERGLVLLDGAAKAWGEAGDLLEGAHQYRRVAELHLEDDDLAKASAACRSGQRLLMGNLLSRREKSRKQLDHAEAVSKLDPRERGLELGHLYLVDAEVSLRKNSSATPRLAQRALDSFARTGFELGRGHAYAKLASFYEGKGELERALEIRRDKQLPAYLAAGDDEAVARTRTDIAELLARVGEVRPALEMIREQVLPAAKALSSAQPTQRALSTLATVLEAQGDAAGAAQIRRDELGRKPKRRDDPKRDDAPAPAPTPSKNDDDDGDDRPEWIGVTALALVALVALVLAWALWPYLG